MDSRVVGTQPADLTCREVCWADTLGLFVGVSDTLGKAMTSADGLNYTIRTCGTNEWEALAWSHELGLLVSLAIDGTGNRVMTSTNGVNWVNRTSAGDSTWLGLAWSPQKNLFVGVGYGAGGAIMTSPNGINWAAQSGGGTGHWTDVCWSPSLGLFVATSESANGSDIMTSPNGTNWVTQTTPAPNRVWQAITWSPQLGLFVAVAGTGTGNRVMTSYNGTNWVNQTSASDNVWTDVAWGAELGAFAAVADTGTGNRIMTSINGTNWVSRPAPAPFNHEYHWASIAYSPTLIRFSSVADIGDINDITTRRVMASVPAPNAPANLSIVLAPGTTNPPVTPPSNTNIWAQRYGERKRGWKRNRAGWNQYACSWHVLYRNDIGSQVLTNAGGRDIFIALFNTNGVAQWAKRFGSTGDEYVTAAEVDNAGTSTLEVISEVLAMLVEQPPQARVGGITTCRSMTQLEHSSGIARSAGHPMKSLPALRWINTKPTSLPRVTFKARSTSG